MTDEQNHVLSLLCETLVYGIFSVVIAVVIYFLCTEKNLTPSRKALFGVAVLQFSLASVHLATLVHGAYLQHENIKFTQAPVFIGQISEFIGACILIWRVWHVWGRRWVIIIIPFLTSLAGLIVGMIFPAALTSRSQLTRILPIPSGAVALAGVIVNTLLIVGRLLYQQWQTKKALGPAYQSLESNYAKGIILMLVESGALIAAAYTAALVFEKRGSPATHIMLNVLEPLSGLNPTVIIVLVHLNRAMGTHTTKRYTETLSAVRFGEGPLGARRPPRDSALDSVTTTKSSTAPASGNSGSAKPQRSDTTLGAGEKPTVEMRETVHFTEDGAMV